jgi:hypothetical protein
MRFQKLYISLGLIGALSLAACEKTIEVEPEFVKEGNQVYQTLDGYESALTGAYGLFRQTGYFGSGAQTTSTWANLPDMMTDNLVQTNEDLANWQNQVNWVYTTDESDIEIAWRVAYSVVAEANLVLRGIDEFSASNAKRVNRIKGQALAIRGMVHFDLLRFWGVEYDRNSTALGIPYVTEVNIDNKPSRLTVKESWDNILKDMLEAETLLGDVDKAVNTSAKAYLDRTAVRALLARMYLYAKDYGKAEEYATKVIDAVPLASKTDFPGIWKDANTSEVLWSVAFNANEGSPSSGVHNGPSNRNRFRQATPLEATYDQDNDVRFASYFGSRPLSGVSRRMVTKFYGRGTATDNVVNWKVVRTGEMYLVRAEARARQGGAKEALGLADLNALRAARITGYTPAVLVGQALLDAIALERQKELVGEGHRWFDLRRTTRTITRTDTELASTAKTLASTAREWVWPIPQGEIDANPNIKAQQSPGY